MADAKATFRLEGEDPVAVALLDPAEVLTLKRIARLAGQMFRAALEGGRYRLGRVEINLRGLRAILKLPRSERIDAMRKDRAAIRQLHLRNWK